MKEQIEPWNVPNAKLGVGAVVFRDDKILLVQINYGPSKGYWILPGGRVENGELLQDALIREVLEETNLNVSFEGILAVRQRILANGNFDIFFMCLCKLTSETNEPKLPDSDELLAVKFWSVDEALASANVRPVTKEAIKMARSQKPIFRTLPELSASDLEHTFG
jgi:8-oxo-dGTP diphosphatase